MPSPSFKNDKNLDNGNDKDTSIIYKFILNEDELSSIEKIKGFSNFLEKDLHNRVIITVRLSEGKREVLLDINETAILEYRKEILKTFVQNNNLNPNILNAVSDESFIFIVQEYSKSSAFQQAALDKFKKDYNSANEIRDVEKYLLSVLPKFIIQKTSDALPDSFKVDNLNDRMIKRLANYLEKDFAEIFKLSPNAQQQKNTLKKYSDKLTLDFESIYTQKKTES